MKDRASQNIKVGLLVIAGTFFFVIALYFIGSKDNLFTAGFKISATFRDVKGLLIGNNVRFSGINIGTVKDLEIVNDSTVRVVMNVQEKARKFIRKNTIASIGTDGLIGNKIIILSSGKGDSEAVKDGDEIVSMSPFDTDASLRILDDTNVEIGIIAKNIHEITERIKDSKAIWEILADTTLSKEIKSTMLYLHEIGANGAVASQDLKKILKEAQVGDGNLAVLLKDTTLSGLTRDLQQMMADIKSGKGALGTIISDEEAAANISKTLSNVRVLTDSLAYVSSQLTEFSKNMNSGAGAIKKTVADSAFLNNLQNTMSNISSSSKKLEENLEGLKHSFLLKRYFKKKEREAKKGK